MGMNRLFDYDFECVTIDTFKLNINYSLKERIFKTIFGLSKKRIDVDVKYKDVKEIVEIDKKFFNLIRTKMNYFVKQIEDIVLKDGIEILHYKVEKALFVKKEKDWIIDVDFKGTYIKK